MIARDHVWCSLKWECKKKRQKTSLSLMFGVLQETLLELENLPTKTISTRKLKKGSKAIRRKLNATKKYLKQHKIAVTKLNSTLFLWTTCVIAYDGNWVFAECFFFKNQDSIQLYEMAFLKKSCINFFFGLESKSLSKSFKKD